MNPAVVVIVAQLFFTASDLLARTYMPRYGFSLAAFTSGWFALYLLLRIPATLGQLYVFSRLELGSTMALFGAFSIVISAALGFLLLGEILTVPQYFAIMLAATAFIVLALT
jgi:multidrug transporter EmrE-like cation transporter